MSKEGVIVLIGFVLIIGGIISLTLIFLTKPEVEEPIEKVYEEVCKNVSYEIGYKNIGEPYKVYHEYKLNGMVFEYREGRDWGWEVFTGEYSFNRCLSKEELKRSYPSCDTDYCVVDKHLYENSKEIVKERCVEVVQDTESINGTEEVCEQVEVVENIGVEAGDGGEGKVIIINDVIENRENYIDVFGGEYNRCAEGIIGGASGGFYLEGNVSGGNGE